MRGFKNSKTWVLLAMLAMFSIAVAPVFALLCCCGKARQTTKGVTPEISAPAPLQSATVPPCHAQGAHTQSAVSQPLSQDTTHASASGPCIQQVCQCAVHDTPLIVVSETAKTSTQLAALALLVEPFAVPSLDAVALRFNADGPIHLRSCSLSSSLGRAPPAI